MKRCLAVNQTITLLLSAKLFLTRIGGFKHLKIDTQLKVDRKGMMSSGHLQHVYYTYCWVFAVDDYYYPVYYTIH